MYENKIESLRQEASELGEKMRGAVDEHKTEILSLEAERREALDQLDISWKKRENSTYYKSLFMFAQWARKAGEYDRALEWLQDVKESEFFWSDPALEFELGLVNMCKGNLPEAVASFGVVLNLQPNEELAAMAQHNMHWIFDRTGDPRAQQYAPMDTEGMETYDIGVPHLEKPAEPEPAGFFG
jgi:tetratricopeptide (TPR) repeat protein